MTSNRTTTRSPNWELHERIVDHLAKTPEGQDILNEKKFIFPQRAFLVYVWEVDKDGLCVNFRHFREHAEELRGTHEDKPRRRLYRSVVHACGVAIKSP